MDIWFILLVIIPIVLSAYKSYKRTTAGQEEEYADDTVAREDDGTAVDFDWQETKEKVPSYSFADRAESAKQTHSSVPVDEVLQAEAQQSNEVKPQFDLRQAVIYQTILNNEYINEINN